MSDTVSPRLTILRKMAQAQNQEAEINGYLKRALATAMANAMINAQYSSAVKKITNDSYQLLVSFAKPINDAAKKKLQDNFYGYIKTNRPDLAGKVALTFLN